MSEHVGIQDKNIELNPDGKITAANADEFRQELLELVESGILQITINLNNVDMIDSKGLAVFIVCHKTLAAKGGSLTVISDNEELCNLFHLMRFDEHFAVVKSE
ncbi:MAG: STAS domain-containing protein [Phycisphaerae bacterium]|nr:STAS domain-containing protein [Phycisphaerae bacterium]